MPGFTFGAATTTTTENSSPFSFGSSTPKTTAPALNLTVPAGGAASPAGFNFGLNKTTASGFGTPAAAPTPGFSGFGTATTTSAPAFGGFGTTATTSTPGFSGFGLGATTTTAATGLGGFGTTVTTSTQGFCGFGTSTTTSSGFSLNVPSLTASTGVGLLGSAPASTSTGLGGGSLFGTPALPGTSAPSIFSSLPTSTTTVGLGGVDPNTVAKAGISGGTTSASDGKILKESFLPDQLTATVDALQKYVKEEKAVREDIGRMSSKPMTKVQEDVAALRQLLYVVSNGLQRNVCSVENLKQDMTRKLKNAEMAQRTKDIPAGLQYENTAPTEYFQRLVEEFEERMLKYRQQIDTLDNHLTSLHQPNPHTPAEVLSLLMKLHETFISLAAQLQQVHEAVKSQEDHYVTYRRVFHGDSKNIFNKPAPGPKTTKKTISELTGPTPFPDTTAGRGALLTHLASQRFLGPPITGLVGAPASSFGTFGSGLFGATKPNQGDSIGGVGNLFSSTAFGSTPGTAGFGSLATQGSSTTAALNLAGTMANLSANTKQPFQLQKPPQGAKRGKR